MDKQLLKAYIRTIVEEEVKQILPKMLAEAVAEVKSMKPITEQVVSPTKTKPKVDRGRLAELMGIDYDRNQGTIRATTRNMVSPTVAAKDAAGNTIEIPASEVPTEVISALNKDYSQLMKAMKLT